MILEFGRYVRSVRLLRGLRVVDVVRKMGIENKKNEAKPIRLITEFEKTGYCTPQLFRRIAEALELDPEKLTQLADEHEKNIERILNMKVTPTLWWFHQSAPTKFGRVLKEERLPAGTTIPAALAWASKLARDNQVEVQVHVSRRQIVIVDEGGNIRRIERTCHSLATEEVTILGQRFHLQVRK